MDKKNFADKNVKPLLLVCLLLLSLVLWMSRKGEQQITELTRPEVGKRSQEIELDVELGDSGESWSWRGSVAARIYSAAELEERLNAAKVYIREHLPREGETLDKVVHGLNLTEEVASADVRISWSWQEKELLDRKGNVLKENLSEDTIIVLRAELRCQELTEWLEIPVCLTPESVDETEQRRRELEEELTARAEEKQEKTTLLLPEEWEGKPIHFTRPEESSYWVLPLLFAGVLLLRQAHKKQELQKQEEERKEEILLQYPDFVSKFVVLMGAGMNLSSVWQRLAAEYERRLEKRAEEKKEALYEEVRLTALELQNGGGERAAYEAFGKRIGLPTCQRFSAILTQNLRMGSERVLEQLEYEAAQALEERKAQARRRGEEMGTKLLFPMMLQLLLILVMVMLPAFISM